MNGETEQLWEYTDTEWPFTYTDHDRPIARAIVFDDAGYFYFVRVQRDDHFGKATLIETSGGGVEPGEDLIFAIRRRAKHGMLSVGGPSSFFTKRLLDEAGGFDEGLHYKMDTDLWNRFYRKCGARYCRVRHNIFAYRQHEASKMSGADSHTTERALINRRRALEEAEVLKQRYGDQTGWSAKLIRFATLSLVDHLVVLWRNFRWKGKRATEI